MRATHVKSIPFFFFISRRVFLIGTGTKVGHDQGDTGSVHLLSGIGTHRGHPGHPTLSSWPVFKSPGTHSPFLWFGHFPTGLLTASYFISPKTWTVSCSFPPSWAWRDPFGNFSGRPPPRPLRYLRLRLGRLPSLLSWRGTVRGPVGGCCPCLLKMSPSWAPLDPLLSRGYPSPTSALSRWIAVYPGKGASPDVPVTPCLPSSSCSLSHFICEFFLIILFKFAVPCLILLCPYSTSSFSLARTTIEHATYYPC